VLGVKAKPLDGVEPMWPLSTSLRNFRAERAYVLSAHAFRLCLADKILLQQPHHDIVMPSAVDES
jgi:hypothetical protein